MITRKQFLQSLQHETNVCKHLFTKIPEGGLDFRPTPGQRSTLELLQHLTTCARAPIQGLLTGDWKSIRTQLEAAKEIPADEFCDAMDQQMKDVIREVHEITDEELLSKEVTAPMGIKTILGEALINYPLKFMTAYRMQLFLYLKQAGMSELTTWNCWGGMDKPENP